MRAVPGRQQGAWKDHLYGRCSPGQSARRWEIDCSQSVGRVGGKEWRRVGRVKNVRARLRPIGPPFESQIELAWKELLCAHVGPYQATLWGEKRPEFGRTIIRRFEAMRRSAGKCESADP